MKRYFIRPLGTLVQTPGAPVITATALSSSSIQVSWATVPTAISYTVRRFSTVIATGVVSPYTDLGLPASTLETYTVSAVNGFGEGPQSAPASATTFPASAVINPVGANFYAGGGTALSFENFPIFKNRVRESRGFTDPLSLGNHVARNAAGWPIADFAVVLWEGSAVPSWLSASSAGNPFKCRFIGTGSETITGVFGGNNIANVVHGFAGAYTTFDYYSAGQGGFVVSGTSGAVTNICAYLPGYNMGTIDDVTLPTAFTNEAILQYSQYRWLRVMKGEAVEFNSKLSTAANRRTPANTQASQGFGATIVSLASSPLLGATSATLSAPWPLTTDTYAIPFHSGDVVQGRVCNMTAGSASFNWTDPLTSNVDTTGLAKIGQEGYPVEWWVSLALACNIGLWLCRPTLEDGTDYAPGSWSSDVLTYLGTHWTSSKECLVEDVNENWNFGGYQSPWAFWGIAKVKGYYATSGNDDTSYYAFRAHTFANLGRSILPAKWGTTVKQVLAYQTNSGGTFYVKKILAAVAALNGGVANTDIHYHSTAPYLHPTLGPADSIATIQATTLARAQISHLAAWTENNVIIAAHWGIPFTSYEDNGDWGNSTYNTITNLPAAILDAGMQTPLATHIQLGFDCGKQSITHFSSGVSAGTSGGYEFTNIYASPLVTSQLSALQSFMGGFSYTRNVVSASGSVINGVNYADNNATISAGQGHLALNSNYMPFGQNGRLPYRINCTDPRANSGPVSYSLVVTWNTVSGTPVTDLWIGDPARGGTQIATAVAVSNGAVVIGTLTLVKGVNHIVLGHNGAQGTSAQNFVTQLQFI